MLGERHIVLNDYHAICATIATLIACQHGADMAAVVAKFDAKTAGMVTTALAKVTTTIVASNDEGILNL